MSNIYNWDQFNMSESVSNLNDAQIEKVAREFSKLLLEEIGEANFKKTVDLNKKEENEGICHSHDFCDANMVMQDAFKAVGIDIEKDHPKATQDQKLIGYWNKAWDLAKSKDMYIDELVK